MPQKVTIDLPLVLSGHDGLTLVRPIGFAEIACASGSEAAALRAVRRRVIHRCRGFVASDLVRCMVRGDATKQTISVAIKPEKSTAAWREAIDVRFDVFLWQQGDAMVIAFIPSLDLTVVATPQTDLKKLVQEQIRSAIRRRDIWSLVGLARLDRTDQMSLRHERIEVQMPTPAEQAEKQNEEPKAKTPTLRAVATQLRRKALRAAYHRDDEVEQLARLLAADQSRSVLLVGPSGVGKTAVFHQWVRRRSEFDNGASLASVACWSTDGSRLISGQSGFGMWQQQCLRMADEARRYRSVVHLGNLVELCESGKLRGSGGCGALLAPRLADGSLQAVIECTPEQLTRIQRVEPRLITALTILRIDEPTPEQTRSILLEAAAAWCPLDVSEVIRRKRQKQRRRTPRRKSGKPPAASPLVDPEALQVLDRLHRRFRTDAAAPGRPLAFFHAVMSQLESNQILDVPTVIEAFGRQTGLPRFLFDDSVRPDLDRIDQQLRSQVVGQEAVIETLVDMIATLAADLSRGDRPLASLMLIGPTGVGKTETAKALARLIYSDVSRLVRIDMSELSTPSAVGRLIGDGLHPEGVLTSAVRAQPFSLVLLDEFEKAHPSVFDLLLQVLGEGRLTDGRGRVADFRNSIVLMTSNLGVDTFRPVPLGLADTQQKQRYRNHFERQVRDFLRPEMFNRIDRILSYDPLDGSTVQQIAGLRIDELKRRDGWQSHGATFEVDADALQSLARTGYQPQYGARPLMREIERHVVIPLSEVICESGRLAKLDVGVTTTASDRVAVTVKTNQGTQKRVHRQVESLIEQMTTLRRRSQSLQRCDAIRRVRNQYTMVSRKLKVLLRSAKSQNQRDKIRYGPLGADRMKTRQRIWEARRLTADIDAAESRLLASYYRGEAIDVQQINEDYELLREQLWTMLCELQSPHVPDNQRMTLVISGANLASAEVLIAAYRRLATERHWNLQVHALLRRERNSAHDRVLDCAGWSEEPAFRVATERDRIEEALENILVNGPGTKPSLAAYRMIGFDALTTPPSAALGLMLTFRGKYVALMVGGEAGVHTFNQLQEPRSNGCSFLVDAYQGMPIDYVAPDWLPRRDFQLSGLPRRWYDVDNELIQDMTSVDNRFVKLDREGVWLEKLVEQETERRIWAELDEA